MIAVYYPVKVIFHWSTCLTYRGSCKKKIHSYQLSLHIPKYSYTVKCVGFGKKVINSSVVQYIWITLYMSNSRATEMLCLSPMESITSGFLWSNSEANMKEFMVQQLAITFWGGQKEFSAYVLCFTFPTTMIGHDISWREGLVLVFLVSLYDLLRHFMFYFTSYNSLGLPHGSMK